MNVLPNTTPGRSILKTLQQQTYAIEKFRNFLVKKSLLIMFNELETFGLDTHDNDRLISTSTVHF